MSIANHLKTALFLGLLSALVLAIGFLVGGIPGLTIAFILAILINFLSFFIAHEIGHIQNRDILIQTIASSIALSISYPCAIALYTPMGGHDDNRGRSI